MRKLFYRLSIFVLALAVSVGAGAVSADGDCSSVKGSFQKDQLPSSCVNNLDDQSVADNKAMYAGGSDSVVIFRVKDRGTSVLGVVTVVILVPGMAILFGSWLAKSSK